MHSSQKPAEKPLLTKGRTVDSMVKRLSSDSPNLPPPKTNILVSPNVTLQHNRNQPFSYTRGISPENYNGNDLGNPVIYAQVICANGASGPSKQTVHTVFTANVKKHPQFSDSDEGLGYEEYSNRKYSQRESTFPKKYDAPHISKLEDEGYLMVPDKQFNPKNKSIYFSGYSYDNAFTEVVRGRADGMDAKRRESSSESIENGSPKINDTAGNNCKSDWSARRDLLESRIKFNLNEKVPRDISQNNTNMLISESTLNYYNNKSEVPVDFSLSQIKSDVGHYIVESRNETYPEDRKDEVEYRSNGGYSFEQRENKDQFNESRFSSDSRHFECDFNLNDRFETKMERQQRLARNRSIYQSNPEIYDELKESSIVHSYHDSLGRTKKINESKRYLGHNENARKDKLGDSGIENDIGRECSENLRGERRRIFGTKNVESEDEGFASSLLIASERQHTDEAVNIKQVNGDYEYDAPYDRDEYDYKKQRNEFIQRERSIDEGFRIDENFENVNKMIVKGTEKKVQKLEKKSGLEKVKQLFLSPNKKKEKQKIEKEEDFISRYIEYKGSTERLEPQIKKREIREVKNKYDYKNRSRLPTPSPEPSQKYGHSYGPGNEQISDSNISHSWFKSLDRLSRNKTRKDELKTLTSTEQKLTVKSPPPKNLRFFGDSLHHKNIHNNRSRPNLIEKDKVNGLSTRELHNISEETRSSRQRIGVRNNHKLMLNVSESDREANRSMKSCMKPPKSSRHRSRDPTKKDKRINKSKNEASSLESSTEGDSSQQSQRSIVYLHAATVGDIPGPGFLRNSSTDPSREELSSSVTTLQPRVKTLSRSFSMLAPWKPKYYRESVDIDYSQYPKPVSKTGRYEQKFSKNGSNRSSVSSTLKKKAHESRKSNENISTFSNHRSRSKENISSSQTLKRYKDESARNSYFTFYKEKDRLPRDNSRYNKERDDNRFLAKSVSVESLGVHARPIRGLQKDIREVSRSVSMPRDAEKSAGWFKMGRKNKNVVSQRL